MDTLNQIVEQLNKWAYEYYVLDSGSVEDSTYDALYDKLVLLEKQTGIVLPNSPTRRVGDVISKQFSSHTHLSRLYSLDKVNTIVEVNEWITKVKTTYPNVTFSVELKYDGLTINLTYSDGVLVRATTRGNGVVGEDITQQTMTIGCIPLTINEKGTIEIQGEGYMTLSCLAKFNSANPNEQLKNVRNAAAGALRNLDTSVTKSRNLNAVFYNIGYSDSFIPVSQQSIVDFLKSNKFLTNFKFEVVNSFSQVEQIINEITQSRDKYDFLIDGIVIKVNEIDIRNELGYTDKFPRWAVAYKFEAEEATTSLLDVLWQVGRTGKVTPLALLEPVELCGATIKRATLNNFGDITRKNLSINSLVSIRRSNDVIPEVLCLATLTEQSKPIEKPNYCPSCDTQLEERGANLFCNNHKSCFEQIVARLTHFSSKNAMDIDGLSDKTIIQLVNNGVYSFSQLYSLNEQFLSKLDGFKDKKVNNLILAIRKSVTAELPQFIYSLGIDNIGIVTAKELSKIFGSIDKLSNASLQQLINISSIGEVVASSIIDFFSDSFNIEEIEKLKGIGINPTFKVACGIFNAKSFVLTGTLSNYSREQATKIIEQLGGRVTNSVSKTTSYLLCGEQPGSKRDKAIKLGVEIMNESQFSDLINTK